MSAKPRIPATKPDWTGGRYYVVVDGLMVGYFRQFKSAWNWRVYLAASTAAAEILIYDHNELASIWRRNSPDYGNLLNF
jgi:hypothetical protein